NQRVNHPWQDLNDIELLKSAGLYVRDYKTGKEGFTLASILLLGKDEVIAAVLPHYRTDAILRRVDIDRYDDRDDIRTNLIESYDRLMVFVEKHLSDKFYLENDQRISLRNRIFREVISNILIHRDYSNPFPAKFIINKDVVITENSNKPHGHGAINPEKFSPFPKNPIIAKFFKEIGWVDELGSGVRNIYKYSKSYSGRQPELIEEDIFKIEIPTPKVNVGKSKNKAQDKAQDRAQDKAQDKAQDNENISNVIFNNTELKIIGGLKLRDMSKKEIVELLEYKSISGNLKKAIENLLEKGIIEYTIPDKVSSKNQKYRIK
ncbi:MAG: ATP-binding protein, partial [Clostridium sp.]